MQECLLTDARSIVRSLFGRMLAMFRERCSRVSQSVTAPPFSFSGLNFSEVSKGDAESLKNLFIF
jgi:hypothetical protein